MFFLVALNSQEVPHDFELKFEVYCHKLHEEFSAANTPKKIRKKITDISGSVGRSVGKRLSGLVSNEILNLNHPSLFYILINVTLTVLLHK